MVNSEFEEALIVVLAGSRVYGTHSPASDVDYRGIIPAKREMLLGLESWNTQIVRHEPDIVLYTLPKFVKLALGANPNILDTLFAPDDAIVKMTKVGSELREMRRSFLSKRVYTTFTGYAHAQMQKLRNPGGHHGVHRDLIDKWGYDTKNAMHLVRLYRMGYEALTDGVIRVGRPDAEELLEIRNGAWSLQQVEQFAEEMNRKCEAALAETKLPDEPDTERILTWLMDTQLWMLNGGV
ncbi:nucleotidyltransferase domain-containing protein [Alicyclobacillus dauci]|uniref:Nucleotidyltransferase domain-containing protein n=1 Tax=Alicyclobacillus dauci TaxID=1475485 RepID=A0ABY6Z0D7_9BACL|nr:nucleotidyltransferase domain-containing protein [Alicyclobacillus dauci]WAH36043.1 nucleotidyltransferase domain-containing protein [Alicyclobacillus dauci]